MNDRGEAQSVESTFCLIDWYKLDDNAPTTERTYWDCETSYQGISPGWVDQYHQELEGQQIDLTGAPVGVVKVAHSPCESPGMCGERATNR